jgi:hypothetical protein
MSRCGSHHVGCEARRDWFMLVVLAIKLVSRSIAMSKKLPNNVALLICHQFVFKRIMFFGSLLETS